MNSTGFPFYEDQKRARIGKCASILKNFDDSDLIFAKRASQQRLIKNKDLYPVPKCTITEAKQVPSVARVAETFGESLFEMPSTSDKEQFSEQNRNALKEVAMVCKRYRIFDRGGAAVATATLNAFGIVNKSESKFVSTAAS